MPLISAVEAKTVKIELTAKEITVPIDNEGHTAIGWTYNGQIPGPLFRATEGDTIEFTLKNDPGNKNSHSIDFHSARTDVLTSFASIKPGESKTFTFTADHAGDVLLSLWLRSDDPAHCPGHDRRGHRRSERSRWRCPKQIANMS